MALPPHIRSMIAVQKLKHAAVPDTLIPSDRFHALVKALNEIDQPVGEARDKAIHYALVEVGMIAPDSWASYYE